MSEIKVCKRGHKIVGKNARPCNGWTAIRCAECDRRKQREYMRLKRGTKPENFRGQRVTTA